MRMMLMSVSSILMTLQINWVLIEVPLSVWSFFFFCLAKCYRGPCQSVVSSPWRRLPSILTLKGHFPPEFWISAHVGFFCLTGGKTFSGFCGVRLNCWCFFGKNGVLITCSAAWLRFANPRQRKKALPSSSLVTAVVSHCFYWPNWRDWQEAHGK